MLHVSGLAGNSTTHPPATTTSIDGGEAVEPHQEGGGNRWSHQETMVLLNIRSEMDATFRHGRFKSPLWEEVSRKMLELGYNRNAKKCREKFENLFKYHKRIKEGRSSKSDGKTYKFFDQLTALENVTAPPSNLLLQLLPPPSPLHEMVEMHHQVVHADPISVLPPGASPPSNVTAAQPTHDEENYTLSLSSSSDERRRKRKKKEQEFFSEVMKGVIEKQEELQMKFLERLEKKEKERMTREEAWRNQETERIKREYELLAQERSMEAKRHSTLISLIEKITHHYQNLQTSTSETNIGPLQQSSAGVTQLSLTTMPLLLPSNEDGIMTLTPPLVGSHPPVMVPPQVAAQKSAPRDDENGGGESSMARKTSPRWPKAEVDELIKIRTSLEYKYQEIGPKAPLWQEVSVEMSKAGYNRSSLRCKEKWENINKYFKRVKDCSKKRSEASKTCPYFHQLDLLYKEKAKGSGSNNTTSHLHEHAVKPDNPMIPIMDRPEEDPEREDVNHGFDELEGDEHACMNEDKSLDREERGTPNCRNGGI